MTNEELILKYTSKHNIAWNSNRTLFCANMICNDCILNSNTRYVSDCHHLIDKDFDEIDMLLKTKYPEMLI